MGGCRVQLLLQAGLLCGAGRVIGFELAALLLQHFQLGPGALQRRFACGDIQRGIGGDGGVFLRSAQRAGFTGLQCVAVGFQALNALLLRQYFLFVADFFSLLCVLAAQADKCGALLLQSFATGLQIGAQRLLLLLQRIALAGVLL